MIQRRGLAKKVQGELIREGLWQRGLLTYLDFPIDSQHYLHVVQHFPVSYDDISFENSSKQVHDVVSWGEGWERKASG